MDLRKKLLLFCCFPVLSYAGEEWVNVAPRATAVSAHYTAPWNYLYAVNDGVRGYGELANASTWASWSEDRPAEGWIVYEWAAPLELARAEVCFWTDNADPEAGGGVAMPAAWKIQHWDEGASAWTDVELCPGQSYTRLRLSPNKVEFTPVVTRRLRLWMKPSTDGKTYAALGVTEWEVYTDSPLPSAEAGSDYPIRGVPFHKVHFSDSFWAPRIKRNQQVTIPIALEQCYKTGRVDNFRKAAGLMDGYFSTEYPFDDTDIYKIVEGMSYSIQMFPDAGLETELDTLISLIAAAQEPDGYLYTARTAGMPGNLHPWIGAQRWETDPQQSHELYNSGHLFEAAVAHYEATGKRTLLDVALKNADLLVENFLHGGLTYEPGHQIVEMGLVKLYRVTGNEDYLSLAKYFLDLRGRQGIARDEYNQTHRPVIYQDEAVGHAVRAVYMYSGMADVAALTGDELYTAAIDRIWENVVGKKYYVTGGIGATGSGEAFGDNYYLPNQSAYCETCAAIGNVYWNYRMFLRSGDSKYYDVLERTLYNGVISGVSLSGDRFFYPNPLESEGEHARSEWFGCACCPSNLCRFMASVPGYAYAVRGDSLYVNLFVTGEMEAELETDTVRLSQETDYPWDGAVAFTVKDPGEDARFSLLIRIPGWASGQPVPGGLYRYIDVPETGQPLMPELRLNGQPVEYTYEKGYLACTRTWQAGDRVSISFPMPVRRVEATEEVGEDRGKVAFERGPVVYCLEGYDNDGEVLNSVVADDDSISVSFRPDFLGGVAVLTMDGASASRDAADKIFTEPKELTAIPYYSWNNRGSGEMEVWVARSADYARLPLLQECETDTLHFDLSQEPFREDTGGGYPYVAVAVDIIRVGELLGLSASEVRSAFGNELVYAAVNPDGSLDTHSTANDPGHWFNRDGYVTNWGASSSVYSEFDLSSFSFRLGQYPGVCQEGDEFTVRQSLTYTPAVAEGRQAHRVVFVFHFRIGGTQVGIDTLPGNDPKNFSISQNGSWLSVKVPTGFQDKIQIVHSSGVIVREIHAQGESVVTTFLQRGVYVVMAGGQILRKVIIP